MIKYRVSTRYNYLIGIDPDADKSGVAFINVKNKKLSLYTLTFPDTLDYLKRVQHEAEVRGATYQVIIEAGWQAKAHWHLHPKDSQQKCAALGNAVGRNHETGRKLCEMMTHWKINYREQHPLVKHWGKTGKEKISQNELNTIVLPQHNIAPVKQSNPETRDATLIALTGW